MEDNKQTLFPLERIPPGSRMPIEITTNLFTRIQQLLFSGLPFLDKDHFERCIKEAKELDPEKILDPMSYHAQTIIFLIGLIEDAAKKQGITQMVNFNTETLKFED